MKPSRVLAKAAKKVRDAGSLRAPDGRIVHPVLKDAKMELSSGLKEAGVPGRIRKKVVAEFYGWAVDRSRRFPKRALDALNEVPVDLPSTPVWDLPPLTEGQAQSLMDRNIQTYGDVKSAENWDLLQIPGIGEKTIRKLDRLQQAELAA